MAATIVQSADGHSTANGTTFAAALASQPTVNNTLVLVVGSNSTVVTPTGWTLAQSAIDQNALYIFYKTAGVGEPTSVTVTKNATSGHTFYIAEVSGLFVSGQLDQTASANSSTTNTTKVTGTTAATAQAAEFIVAASTLFHQNSGATIISSWSGITALTSVSDQLTTSSGNTETGVATCSVAATGSYQGTATLGTAFARSSSAIATFKILGAGTPVAATATKGTAVTVTATKQTLTTIPITVTTTQTTAVTQARAVGIRVTATQATSATGVCGLQKSLTISATKATAVTVGLVRNTTTRTVTTTQATSVTVAVVRNTFARQMAAVTITAISISLNVTRSVTPVPISFQVETWLAEVEMHLLSGDKDERNLLSQAIAFDDNQITFTGSLNGIQEGAYLGIDLEVLYVVAVNESANQATVIRGTLASPPAIHAANSVVYVNPRFSRWQIFKAINAGLRDLSAPPNMIFQVKSCVLTTQPVAQTYTIPTANTDIISILELRYSVPDASRAWPRISRREFSLLRNMPTDTFTSGMALRLDEAVYPGRPMTVRYAAPLGELVNLTDDVLTQTGLPATAADIPPLYAAARLMGVRDAKRSFTESAMDAGRFASVPPGSATRAAASMLSMLNARVRSEASRLEAQYPELV